MGNNISSQVHPNLNVQKKKFVLGIIDIQNDFCTGGSLAVENSNLIIGPINKLRFICFNNIPTFISQDFHKFNHMSFAETHNANVYDKIELNLQMEDGTFQKFNQQLWPVHCVENTYGSDFHQDLIVTETDKIILKGTKKNVESYSAFGDEFNGKYEKTDLEFWLKSNNITDIILTGIATDYCVYYTALDAIRLGFKVHLINSCTRGVSEVTTLKAINDMSLKGVIFYENVDKFYDYWKINALY
jgi:nicotinamidase/pyrazinamidase